MTSTQVGQNLESPTAVFLGTPLTWTNGFHGMMSLFNWFKFSSALILTGWVSFFWDYCEIKGIVSFGFCIEAFLFFFKAFEREVQAHRAVDHPNVLLLHDYDVVSKGTYKEARMLVAYYKVRAQCLFLALGALVRPGVNF